MSAKPAVTESPEFQRALAYAKGLAAAAGTAELSSATMAAGFCALVRTSAEALPAAIASRIEVLEGIVQSASLKVPEDLTPIGDRSFPLAPDLQAVFRHHGTSLDDFLGGLIKAQQKPELSLSPAFAAVMRHATCAAQSIGATSVGADAFAVGAYFAFQEGDLTGSSSLAAHVAANVVVLEALIQDRGFARPAAPNAAEASLPLAEDFRALLLKEKGRSLVPALNPGLAAGAQILSKHRVAYHEAGHAVVSHVLRPELPVMTVSIVDKGEADGITAYDPGSPFWNRMRASDLMTGLCVSLAGRAAERLKFGLDEMDSGASADLTKATRMAWKGITRFGLDEGFCPIDMTCLTNEFHVSTGWLYDEAQRRLVNILRDAATRSEEVLKANWGLVEALVICLQDRREIEFEDFIESLRREGLACLAGAVRVQARSVERQVTFALAAGVQVTAEGPVRYDAGDALVTDGAPPAWPVRRGVFDARYEAAGGQRHGEGGLYRKLPHGVTALQIHDAGRVDLAEGRGVLMAQRGDWLVDYGGNDIAVVSAEAFTRSYLSPDA